MSRPCDTPLEREAALSLLRKGEGTPTEIAIAAGLQAHTVRAWADRAGIDWRHIRAEMLKRKWSGATRSALGLTPRQKPSKQEMRETATRAKEQWDWRNAIRPSDSIPDAADGALREVRPPETGLSVLGAGAEAQVQEVRREQPSCAGPGASEAVEQPAPNEVAAACNNS